MASDNVYGTLYNADSVAISNGMLIRISGNNRGVRALADSPPNVQGLVGVNIAGIVGIGGPMNVALAATNQKVLCETGLTLAVGDTLYVSGTVPGRATNLAPGIAIAIGSVSNIGSYATDQRAVATVSIPSTVSTGSGVFPGYYSTAANTGAAASGGVSALVSRGDHVHRIGFAIPVDPGDDNPQPVGNALAPGTSAFPARLDHVHTLGEDPLFVPALRGLIDTVPLPDGFDAGANSSVDGDLNVTGTVHADTDISSAQGIGGAKLTLSDGSAQPVSSGVTAALRYNLGTDKIQYSKGGGPWTDLV